jgi:capsular exopolysaccharide synthesis family protein
MAESRKQSGSAGGAPKGGGGAGTPHVLDRLAVIIKYWKAVVAMLVLVVAFMMQGAYTEIPMFQADARLQILEEQTAQAGLNSSVVAVTDTEAFYETQLRILQGRELASRAVRSLKLETVPEFNGTGPTPTRLTQTLDFLKAKIMSPFKGEPAPAPSAPGEIDHEDLVGALQGRINVSQLRGSQLVDVSFTSTDPEFAAKAANVIAEEYVKQNIEFRVSSSGKSLEFLTEEVAKQKAIVLESERKMTEYRESQNAISLDSSANIVGSRLSQVSDNHTRARQTRLQREVQYKQVMATTDPKERASLSVVASSPTMQNLRGQINTLERERARLKERYGDNHPDVQKVLGQLADAQRQISVEVERTVQTIKNDYEAAAAEEKTALQELEQQKYAATDLGRKSVDYSALVREAESNREVYERLLQQENELRVLSNNRQNNVRLLERARVPGAPYSPDINRAWMMAIIFGLGLGVAAAFAIDYLDDTIKTPDDVRLKLKLPFLGVAPKVQGNERPLLSETVPPHFGEAFRALRTALVNASTDKDTKIILTTSSQPQEGKTTVTVNLALALAIGGARVLVIDADMRRPSLHKALKLTNEKGLAELLSDTTRMREVVRRTSHPNLVAITAGDTPPNPSELLGGERMKTLLRQLSQSPFDWVIIDTPPVLAVTDAVILAPLVSGVTFIIGAEMTRWRMAERALETLAGGKPKSIAAVLNRVDLERNRYYYWRYYGHQYYGYYGEKKAAS